MRAADHRRWFWLAFCFARAVAFCGVERPRRAREMN